MNDIETSIKNLTCELLRYCGPIFVAPALDSYPKDLIGNGTYALIDTGEMRLLVTCCHVWDKFQEQHDADNETILAVVVGEGDSVIAFKNPERHRIAINRDIDLVVFEFEPEGLGVRHNKTWFKISEWPIPKIANGECIVTLGFPGAWRTTVGTECNFKGVAIPLVVTDTTDRTLAAFSVEENQSVLSDMKDAWGGISGSPAYRLTKDGELQIVGFAKVGPLESDSPDRKYQSDPGSSLSGLCFAHASFLLQNGELS